MIAAISTYSSSRPSTIGTKRLRWGGTFAHKRPGSCDLRNWDDAHANNAERPPIGTHYVPVTATLAFQLVSWRSHSSQGAGSLRFVYLRVVPLVVSSAGPPLERTRSSPACVRGACPACTSATTGHGCNPSSLLPRSYSARPRPATSAHSRSPR